MKDDPTETVKLLQEFVTELESERNALSTQLNTLKEEFENLSLHGVTYNYLGAKHDACTNAIKEARSTIEAILNPKSNDIPPEKFVKWTGF
jgi:FtsZ-binding cell division protein ZapB